MFKMMLKKLLSDVLFSLSVTLTMKLSSPPLLGHFKAAFLFSISAPDYNCFNDADWQLILAGKLSPSMYSESQIIVLYAHTY